MRPNTSLPARLSLHEPSHVIHLPPRSPPQLTSARPVSPRLTVTVRPPGHDVTRHDVTRHLPGRRAARPAPHRPSRRGPADRGKVGTGAQHTRHRGIRSALAAQNTLALDAVPDAYFRTMLDHAYKDEAIFDIHTVYVPPLACRAQLHKRGVCPRGD